jgi:hypothetical protein
MSKGGPGRTGTREDNATMMKERRATANGVVLSPAAHRRRKAAIRRGHQVGAAYPLRFQRHRSIRRFELDGFCECLADDVVSTTCSRRRVVDEIVSTR